MNQVLITHRSHTGTAAMMLFLYGRKVPRIVCNLKIRRETRCEKDEFKNAEKSEMLSSGCRRLDYTISDYIRLC